MKTKRILYPIIISLYLTSCPIFAEDLVGIKAALGNFKPEAVITKQPTGFLRENSVAYFILERPSPRFEIEYEGLIESIKVELSGPRTTKIRSDIKDDKIEIMATRPGVYQLAIKTGHKDYRFIFPKGTSYVLEASEANPLWYSYYGNMFFYVPEGTKTIKAKAKIRLSILPPETTKRVDSLNNQRTDTYGGVYDSGPRDENGYFDVEIPVGDHDGKVWCLNNQTRGLFYFVNIPPYLALHPKNILLPRGSDGASPR